jgi:hypothetical protein
MSSCQVYYQVYKVQPINDLSKSNNSLVYEDTNCKIQYDFWGEGGNVGFMLYNKSDKDIYVNMKESFFIYNGIAYDYYKNREFTSEIGASKTSSVSASKTTAFSKTSSLGVNMREKEVICIPPKSAKVISEYNINKVLYRDCNLFLYPLKEQIKTSHFSEKESPFIFSNRISYIIEGTNTPIKMEHKFYVSEISNYRSKDITEYRTKMRCEDEQPTTQKIKYFKDVSPDKFYIRYSEGTNRKH